MWPVAVLTGAIGALLSAGLFAAAGGVRDGQTSRPVRDSEAPPSVAPATLAAAARARVSVVEVKVDRGPSRTVASGLLLGSDGTILTSAELVRGVDRMVVSVSGEPARERPAELLGLDEDTGLALVRVAGGGLQPAAMGSAAAVEVGQLAIVLGPPLAVGVIRARGSHVNGSGGEELVDMIETDAPTNLSSRGAPLVDGNGAVVGVITVVQGHKCWAVPVETARDVASQLAATGSVVRAWLGVEGTDVDPSAASQLGVAAGALVRRVAAGSAAQTAGVTTRDVIVMVDAAQVPSMEALKVLLRAKRPGDVVELTIVRGGRPTHLRARLTERPPST